MGLRKRPLTSQLVREAFFGERPEGASKKIERNFDVLVGVSVEAGPQ